MSETPVFKDMLGTVVKENDFVAYILAGNMYVGVVQDLVHSGKSVRVLGAHATETKIVYYESKILVIDDTTKTSAMIHKLSRG